MKKLTAFWLMVCLFSFAGMKPEAQGIRNQGIIKANGIYLAYESFGSQKNETILLIQGTGAQLTGWPVTLCEQLADKGYRVIRFDNRDAGLSSSMDTLGNPDWASIIPKIGTCDSVKLPYTLRDMAADAVGLLDALHIKKANIVGASMGGAIAQLVAIYYPERTLSLTSIMASSGNPKLPPGNPDVLKVMGTPPPNSENPDTLARYLFTIYKALSSPGFPAPDSKLLQMAKDNVKRSWRPLGTARQAAAIVIGDHCDRREMLKKINVPVVVIHGEADPVVNIEAGKEVAATIPYAKLITIPGMGHDLPEALVSKVRDGILLAVRKN